jgi:O-antigen ligase
MILVIIILIFTVSTLVWLANQKGLEATLPFFAFMAVLSPLDCSVAIPGLFDLNTQRLMLVTLIGLYLISGKQKRNFPPIASTPLKILILVHIIWTLVSTVNSVEPIGSLKIVLSMVFEYYILYYLLIRTISRTKTIRKMLFGMVLGIMVCSVFGAFEAYTGWSVLTYFPARMHLFSGSAIFFDDEARGLRVRSTFPHAILYGQSLAMAIIWAFYLLATAKGLKEKVVLWVGLMLMFLNIFKTTSRGPWIGLVASVVLLLFICEKSVRRYILVIALLSYSVCVIRPGVWDSIKGLYFASYDLNSPTGSSYEYRYALLTVGEQALAKDRLRQLWGYGLGTFYSLHLRGEFLGNPDHEFLSCDSSWIELMVETGYVGLVSIVLVLAAAACRALKDTWKLPRPHKYLSWIFFITMLSFYYAMTSVAIYAWGQNGYMLWILISLSVVHRHLARCEAARVVASKSNPDVSEALEISHECAT